MDDETLLRIVRLAIYASIQQYGVAPAVADVASADHLDVRSVEEAYLALARSHVIVLQAGTFDIWSAPPFSAVPTAFRTTPAPARSSWYAPCAWDAFGIPAALTSDAQIEARCAWSGEAIPCGVEDGRAYGTGVIHLLVPAAQFWDDIVFT
jgi:hypothetical protein